MSCYCGGGASYRACCQPYHQGINAPTAEQLMRSRYSAFVVQDIDYIVKTTVPKQAPLLDRLALLAWAKSTNWQKLTIIRHTAKLGKRHAQVHFVAQFIDEQGWAGRHDELSAFVKISEQDGTERWYFLDPTLPIGVTGKQPCLCGSGDKFKHCCGRFLP